ncbi:MAG: CCA tRNA nucleotidyltransferase [Acidobacteria bacterium]|nr:CCA tRNA nucleotidyltransferase [Acidobacteriota bacterium]
MDAARQMIGILRRNGYSAYLVGGCVRDLLLGRQPKDFDIAASAPPDEVERLFPGSDLVGAHFGVVLVRWGGEQVEVAAYRGESGYSDHRHPDEVHFEQDPRADAVRRDFTINAMMMDPETGEVLDYVGGRADLAAGIIRAVGDPRQRFAEDHLRMLRAVRFAARFGFVIEPGSLHAIEELAGEIRTVSKERVRDELDRILVEGDARLGFELMARTGLLNFVIPEVMPPPLEILGRLRDPSHDLAWAALLHQLDVDTACRVLARLRSSTDRIRQVEALLGHRAGFGRVREMPVAELKRFLRVPRIEEHLELQRLECEAAGSFPADYAFAAGKLREFPRELLWPARLVTGDDLSAAGLAPGPQFREILHAIETAQLEGTVVTRDQAARFVKDNFSICINSLDVNS